MKLELERPCECPGQDRRGREGDSTGQAYPAGVAFLFIAFPCNLCHIVARWPSKLKMKATVATAAAFVVDCNILMTV